MVLKQRERVYSKGINQWVGFVTCHVRARGVYGLTLCLGETKSSLEPLIKVNIPVFQFKAADF